MQIIKRFFSFYINSSIHVALSVFALVQMTQFLFGIRNQNEVPLFAFFGTIVGYNFVKYDALVRTQKKQIRNQLKVVAVLSFVSFFFAIYFFFKLEFQTMLIGFAVLFLTLLYTLPFFPNKKNARNWAGIKIYIVTICWVGVTVYLPVLNAQIPFSVELLLISVQRLMLVFVLILIFEIIDLKSDDPHLKTVPQQIGVSKTKFVGSLLLLLFVMIEFLENHFSIKIFLLKFGIALTTFLFLVFSNEKKSKYYSTFWVESIPILWWLLLVFV